MKFANRVLLFIEVGLAVILLWLVVDVWTTLQALNAAAANAQQEAVAARFAPAATTAPDSHPVVLPDGHQPPQNGRPPQPGEAGHIPPALRPTADAYQPPATATPGPNQAQRIEIPAIDVDSLIYQGVAWEQLKSGVGQYHYSPPPGEAGNLVLSAHNDIYGAIFRYLDRLGRGDVIYISTQSTIYTYVVRGTDFVEPTEVWVLLPTSTATLTLISCYPYLFDTQRIVVFAELAAQEAR
jgi:sortase A